MKKKATTITAEELDRRFDSGGDISEFLDWDKAERPGLVQHFPLQIEPETIMTFVDTDHAGCLETRKSTTGLVLKNGAHV
ncbi:MAG: hypothetical protein NWQ95_00440, partial [Verrucomicrobiales bacterium]|nr:hypothetical protein [Verrucomicrobiales bacterium]